MHFTTIAFTAFLASVGASAIPAINKVNTLAKRDPTIWDEAGNIKLTFSRESVNIGLLTTEKMMEAVSPICHEEGQCETNDIELKIQLLTSDTVTDLIVTIGPDGEDPTWIRNGLLDTLGAAYCPRTKTSFTTCEVPKYWSINYQDPSVSNAAPPNLGLSIEVKAEGQEDLCERILAGLDAVAFK
ncbi:uncharacterized protein K460DRAFT_374662 [Cucurbitaria berberidis CBS 394.84]|uniref:Uncharacterized protein n=1 Tax=Cucurbitaria berberidis CBS 394.84 TaxID=1168544 RepID=A0A9P4GL82_9PLEO|nr:uncharacterized protein K460DRAFT_374662 [Cucurbitaria berberidis CBS 394.84]KAF1847650.1 hypothetical protein K460DRAFT_374662 [Cucurbitaria berberidis CBS 394.84]